MADAPGLLILRQRERPPMGRDVLAKFGIPDPPTAAAAGVAWRAGTGPVLTARSPIDGGVLAEFPGATAADVAATVEAADAAFRVLRLIPAPVRGEFVRRIGA